MFCSHLFISIIILYISLIISLPLFVGHKPGGCFYRGRNCYSVKDGFSLGRNPTEQIDTAATMDEQWISQFNSNHWISDGFQAIQVNKPNTSLQKEICTIPIRMNQCISLIAMALVGWGETEEKKPSSVLLAALIPYISYTNCRQMVSEDFSNSIASDKFCAGSISGAGARPGDSGGGLMFRDTKSDEGLYYVRGVVSNKDATSGEKETSIAAFTDVAQYLTWIYDKRVEIENEELSEMTTDSQ